MFFRISFHLIYVVTAALVLEPSPFFWCVVCMWFSCLGFFFSFNQWSSAISSLSIYLNLGCVWYYGEWIQESFLRDSCSMKIKFTVWISQFFVNKQAFSILNSFQDVLENQDWMPTMRNKTMENIRSPQNFGLACKMQSKILQIGRAFGFGLIN